MKIAGKDVGMLAAQSPGAPLIVLCGEEKAGEVWQAARAAAGRDFSLALISGLRWEDDLSPWPAPAAFLGQKDFGGGADGFLRDLTEEIVPRLLALLPAPPAFLGLAGYSLAGLFTVWALTKTALFTRAASVSGSLWYPGLTEYLAAHPPVGRVEKIYFSLGDQESRTRNPLLRPVEEKTGEVANCFRAMGTETAFEMNPGNHFREPEGRLARGVAWLVREET